MIQPSGSQVTCTARYAVRAYYQYEINGAWTEPLTSDGFYGNGDHSATCHPIDASEPAFSWCYGTAGSSNGIPGYWGAGNQGTWKISSIGRGLSYPASCRYNWRTVMEVWDWTTGNQVNTWSSERLATC